MVKPCLPQPKGAVSPMLISTAVIWGRHEDYNMLLFSLFQKAASMVEHDTTRLANTWNFNIKLCVCRNYLVRKMLSDCITIWCYSCFTIWVFSFIQKKALQLFPCVLFSKNLSKKKSQKCYQRNMYCGPLSQRFVFPRVICCPEHWAPVLCVSPSPPYSLTQCYMFPSFRE